MNTTTPLTVTQARRLTDRIRVKVQGIAVLLVEAFEGRAPEALGYGSGASAWRDYMEHEFGGPFRLVPAEAAKARKALTAAGASTRAIAAATGVNQSTVARQQRKDRSTDASASVGEIVDAEIVEDKPPRAVKGLDGRTRRYDYQAKYRAESGETCQVLNAYPGTFDAFKREGRLLVGCRQVKEDPASLDAVRKALARISTALDRIEGADARRAREGEMAGDALELAGKIIATKGEYFADRLLGNLSNSLIVSGYTAKQHRKPSSCDRLITLPSALDFLDQAWQNLLHYEGLKENLAEFEEVERALGAMAKQLAAKRRRYHAAS